MITPVSSSLDPSTLVKSGPTTSSALSDANASQDRFLKLLVTQLKNQDPMNPMDNAQMTSQMAQINTVSGIQQVNETIKSLSTQFASLQVMQGASMIGRDVLTQGNALTITNDKARGAIDLPANATALSVQILSPGGQLADTIDMGSKNAGRVNFEWDASNYTGGGTPTFKVIATQGKLELQTNSLSRNTVEAIGNDSGAMSIQLMGRSAVAYDQIKAIL
jgi:flagellar basal-body rod modification protein FlgD